jgi:hypothetical protein
MQLQRVSLQLQRVSLMRAKEITTALMLMVQQQLQGRRAA